MRWPGRQRRADGPGARAIDAAHERSHVVVGRLHQQFIRRADLQHAALVQNRQPVAQAQRFVQVVRDEDDRAAGLGLQRQHLGLQAGPDQRVQRREGLVHHDDVGVGIQRAAIGVLTALSKAQVGPEDRAPAAWSAKTGRRRARVALIRQAIDGLHGAARSAFALDLGVTLCLAASGHQVVQRHPGCCLAARPVLMCMRPGQLRQESLATPRVTGDQRAARPRGRGHRTTGHRHSRRSAAECE
jgi:hypothetical protein